jgi:DNA replication and repair protein RecF
VICKSIEYKNYRNIEAARIEFSPHTTILYGKNAQGKTNMIEGVYMFALGKSHRAMRDSELVHFGCNSAETSLVYESGGRTSTLTMRIYNGHKRIFEKNGVRLSKLSDLIGNFRAVLFSPDTLAVVRDGPSERRAFLDVAISQIKPVYLGTLKKYNHILMQRNALLRLAKAGGGAPAIIEWSEQLAQCAAYIAKARSEYTERINRHAKEFYHDMTGAADRRDGGELVLRYRGTSRTGGDYSDEARLRAIYFAQLTENIEREIMAGSTQYGPHKDDIEITIAGHEARLYGSQGQKRSIAVAMKLAEGEVSREERGEYPVFLFDDVLSELDFVRRRYITSGIKGRQVIVTACDPAICRRMSKSQDGVYQGFSYYVKSGTAIRK